MITVHISIAGQQKKRNKEIKKICSLTIPSRAEGRKLEGKKVPVMDGNSSCNLFLIYLYCNLRPKGNFCVSCDMETVQKKHNSVFTNNNK